jgi:hypothetical protein
LNNSESFILQSYTNLLENRTVVDFFLDYSKLAFGDPAGKAMRRGKFLRYVTRNEALASQNEHQDASQTETNPNITAAGDMITNPAAAGGAVGSSERDDLGIASESAFLKLGEKEGVVDCMYTWWMRRDLFELPALIVINVSVLTATRLQC